MREIGAELLFIVASMFFISWVLIPVGPEVKDYFRTFTVIAGVLATVSYLRVIDRRLTEIRDALAPVRRPEQGDTSDVESETDDSDPPD